MKRYVLFFTCFVFVTIGTFGQNVTNNNSITINGNVYYYRPSTTPSSPLPQVGKSDFIGTGDWYGEDAAKAWSQIEDWVIEHSLTTDMMPYISDGAKVYITSLHSFTAGSNNFAKYAKDSPALGMGYMDKYNGIVIYYWIVDKGKRMEEGQRAIRGFRF